MMRGDGGVSERLSTHEAGTEVRRVPLMDWCIDCPKWPSQRYIPQLNWLDMLQAIISDVFPLSLP